MHSTRISQARRDKRFIAVKKAHINMRAREDLADFLPVIFKGHSFPGRAEGDIIRNTIIVCSRRGVT